MVTTKTSVYLFKITAIYFYIINIKFELKLEEKMKYLLLALSLIIVGCSSDTDSTPEDIPPVDTAPPVDRVPPVDSLPPIDGDGTIKPIDPDYPIDLPVLPPKHEGLPGVPPTDGEGGTPKPPSEEDTPIDEIDPLYDEDFKLHMENLGYLVSDLNYICSKHHLVPVSCHLDEEGIPWLFMIPHRGYVDNFMDTDFVIQSSGYHSSTLDPNYNYSHDVFINLEDGSITFYAYTSYQEGGEWKFLRADDLDLPWKIWYAGGASGGWDIPTSNRSVVDIDEGVVFHMTAKVTQGDLSKGDLKHILSRMTHSSGDKAVVMAMSDNHQIERVIMGDPRWSHVDYTAHTDWNARMLTIAEVVWN